MKRRNTYIAVCRVEVPGGVFRLETSAAGFIVPEGLCERDGLETILQRLQLVVVLADRGRHLERATGDVR